MKISIHIDKIETKEAYAEGIDLVIEGVELADLAAIGDMSLEDLLELAGECNCEGECQVEAEKETELEKLIKSLSAQKEGFEKMKEEEAKAREGVKKEDNPFAENPFFKILEGNVTQLPKSPLTDVLGAFIEAQKEGKGLKF